MAVQTAILRWPGAARMEPVRKEVGSQGRDGSDELMDELYL